MDLIYVFTVISAIAGLLIVAACALAADNDNDNDNNHPTQ